MTPKPKDKPAGKVKLCDGWFGLCWFCWFTALGAGVAWSLEHWWYMGFYAVIWVGHVVLDVIRLKESSK